MFGIDSFECEAARPAGFDIISRYAGGFCYFGKSPEGFILYLLILSEGFLQTAPAAAQGFIFFR